MLTITRNYTEDSENCINVESLDNKTATEEKNIKIIEDEFKDNEMTNIINSTIMNYYLVTGREIKTYKVFRFDSRIRNSPKYYEMLVNRLVNSRANLVISQSFSKKAERAVIIYKNEKRLIVQETSQKIAIGNYIYTEILDGTIKTFCTLGEVLMYFDYEMTDIASLTELEREIDPQKMMFKDMNITINTKNIFISSYYKDVLIISFN